MLSAVLTWTMSLLARRKGVRDRLRTNELAVESTVRYNYAKNNLHDVVTFSMVNYEVESVSNCPI